jgi:peptidyl-dipeptidase Dcp
MLIERYHLDFVLAGAALDADERAALAELNQRLSTLATAFAQNLLQASESASLMLDSEAELDGLNPDAIATAADAAVARGQAGKYAITLTLFTGQPLLKVLRNRDVRRRLFEASINRASSGEHDNSVLVIEIATLRAERARLLGFATHADATVVDQTVRTSAAIDEFLGKLVGPAVANADAEAALLAELAERDGIELAPWGLGVLHRAGQGGAIRRRHRGATTVFRSGPGVAGRRVRGGVAALRNRTGAP